MKGKLAKAVLFLLVTLLVVATFVACGDNIKSFTVTIMDGDTVLTTLSVADGGVLDYEGKVTKEGYELIGLYTDPTFGEGTSFVAESTFDGNLTLYARFAAKKYNIIVKTDDTTTPVSIATGEAYDLSEFTEGKEGYDFVNFTYYAEDGSEVEFPTEGTYSFAKNQLVISHWKIKTFKVTFVDGDESTEVKVDYGAKVAKPTDPAKKGSTFTGWKDGEELFNFNTEIKKDYTLTSDFKAIDYKITVDPNYDGAETSSVTVQYGKEFTLGALNREGYSFVNYTYFTEDGETAVLDTTAEYPLDKSVRVYAHWNILTFKVTFVDGEKSTEVTVDYGAKVAKPADPTKKGHSFTGWKNGEDLFDFNTEIKKEYTLTSDFTPAQYSITIQNYTVGNTTAIYDSTYTLPSREEVEAAKVGADKEWASFIGYYLDKDEIEASGTYIWDRDIIVIAKYEKNEMYKKSTVALRDIPTYQEITVDDGTTLNADDLKKYIDKEGYHFDGWFCGADENAEEFDFDTVINSDITLYAHYSPITCTITINPDGGEGKTSYEVTYDAEYTLEDMNKKGWTFVEYQDKYGETFPAHVDHCKLTGDVIIKAIFKQNPVTIKFLTENEEDYAEKTINQYETLNDITEFPADIKKDGYTFIGWGKDGSVYAMDAEIDSPLTLYPLYTPKTYVIRVHYGEGDDYKDYEFTYPEGYTIPETPIKAGSLFTKYYLSDADDVDDVFSYTGELDEYVAVKDVYVKWEVDTEALVDKGSYFKEKDSEGYVFVFLKGVEYDFGEGTTITKVNVEDTYVNIYNKAEDNRSYFRPISLTAGDTVFGLTVTPAEGEAQTIRARVIESVHTFSFGRDFNKMLTAAESNVFMTTQTKNSYVMDVGKTNFIPDLQINNYLESEVGFVDANLLVEIKDKDNVIVENGYTFNGTSFSFNDGLTIGDTYSLTIRPKYALQTDDIDAVSLTIRLNDGVNVYTSDDLKAAYRDSNVQTINVLRNIVATLADSDYDKTRGGHGEQFETVTLKSGEEITINTGTPYNDHEHGVYVRIVVDKPTDDLVINGNYFKIDGSESLPYIDNNTDCYGKSGMIGGVDYYLSNVQVGIFLYRSVHKNNDGSIHHAIVDGKVTMNNLEIESNYKEELQLATEDVADETKDLLKMSSAYLGVVVRGGSMDLNNVSIHNTLIGITMDGGVSGYNTPGLNGDGVQNQPQAGEKQATSMALDHSKINKSWANSVYAFDLGKLSLTQSEIGSSCGAAIHFDDLWYAKNGAEVAPSRGYSELQSELVMDRYSANHITNFVRGDEAWFKAYGMGTIATGAKVNIQAEVAENTGGTAELVGEGANAHYVATSLGAMSFLKWMPNDPSESEYMNFAIIVQTAGGWDTTAFNNDAQGGPSLKVNCVAGGFNYLYKDEAELTTMVAEFLPELAYYRYYLENAETLVSQYGSLEAYMAALNEKATDVATAVGNDSTFMGYFDSFNTNVQNNQLAAAEGDYMNMLVRYLTMKITEYGTALGTADYYATNGDPANAYAQLQKAKAAYDILMKLGRPYIIENFDAGVQGKLLIVLPVNYVHEAKNVVLPE